MAGDNDAVVASANEIWDRLSSADQAQARRPAELIRQAAARLQAAGVQGPAAEARILLRHVTAMSPAELLASGPLSAAAAADFDQLVLRRCANVPVQHLTGKAPFRYAELNVGPGVFIPRPETELVAQAAIDEVRRRQAAGQSRVPVVELCAGSGAISRSLLDEVPGVEVTAVELSMDAMPFLSSNLEGRAELFNVDFRDLPAVAPQLLGSADVVVANPPYLPEDQDLDEVVRADPAMALFGGSDGLAVIRDLVPLAHELLAPGGLLVMEHGDDQAEDVLELLVAAGFHDASDQRDLAGRARFATARRATANDLEGA